MKTIDTLKRSDVTEAMLYKYKGDDGLHVYYSHGRMEWFRSDTRMPVDIYCYSYWE